MYVRLWGLVFLEFISALGVFAPDLALVALSGLSWSVSYMWCNASYLPYVVTSLMLTVNEQARL